MQRNDLKREGSEGSMFVFKGQDDTAYFPKVRKMSHTAIDQVIQQKNQGPQGNHEARQQGARGNHRSRENHETKGQQRPQRSHKSQGSLGSKEYRGSQGDQRITHVPKGHQGPKGHQEPLGSQCYHEPQGHLEEEGEIHRCQSYTNIYVEKFTSLHPLQDSQTATTEPKEDKATTKTSSPLSGRGVKSSSLHASIISDKPNVLRQSLEGTEKQEVTRANLSTKKTKRTSFSCDTAQRDEKIIPSHDSSYEQQNYYEDYCQQKVTSEELTDIIRNVMTWIVAAVTSILYPVITKYEERVKSSMYPMSADSSLSSESSSCCSTCSEMFTYKTTKTVQAEPGVKGADRSMERTPSHTFKTIFCLCRKNSCRKNSSWKR
ncbi:fibrous sheath-interacting protein 2-like [Tupaia chinensis]|uniref:fibrous sheath-interacting protein 2-like n=1 Tax=Tupaia chinensis TaxID=246437 RepID=UPI000FFB9F29|nr:fibrous sheath-interacting protein 2-like [Tupaia chinensis]